MAADTLFGTDGIRGRAGEEPFRPATLARIGAALAEVALRPGAKASIVVGHDGRASSGPILGDLVPPLLAAGADVVDVGLVTTPGLAHLARERGFSLGIMISASHNPPSDNGIKVFGRGGTKLSDRTEAAVERRFRSKRPFGRARKPGSLRRESSLVHEVVERLVRDAAPGLALKGMRICVDCANGGASRIAPAVFARLGAAVVPLFDTPDGTNINVGCGALHPETVAEEVRNARAELGLALDGDGDRAAFVDEGGRPVPGEAILLGLARDALERKALRADTLVTTVMANTALRRALEAVGGRLVVVPVGDRAVVEAMRRDGFVLGGEPSGHVVFDGPGAYTGDGVFTALRVLECLRRRGERLSAWRRAYRPFPQSLLAISVAAKPPLESIPSVEAALATSARLLGADGRVVLRYSGTEPVARVFVEGPDGAAVRESAIRIAGAIRDAIGTRGA